MKLLGNNLKRIRSVNWLGLTYRCEDGDEITLRPLEVECSIDRDLSLMWQVDAEITIPVCGCNSITTDSIVAANTVPISWRY
ncbi:GSCOCG00000613001-RA-CDS [Cotesia congregata]|nr:GSCOCG00000613001-RA-CDS [Cotesia congregata]